LPILAVYALISALIHPAPGDEGVYLLYAKNLTHGFYAQTVATNPSAYLWHGPGLPLLLAPLVAIHVPLAVTRLLVGPVLLFAALVVFHRLVRLYLNARRAVIATYVLALYLPFFAIMGQIYVEPLATLCFTVAAFFIVRSFRGGRYDHVGAAAALALLALSRVEFGYVVLAAFVFSSVWMLVSRRSPFARRSVAATLVALALCTPWLVYTYSLTSKPFYWGNSGGLSLYWMTAPGNLGDWHGKDVFTTPQLAAERPWPDPLSSVRPL
jgi:4-amino-4-deoxy-L-arabinose transferase-like glycosyltransferase